VNAKLCFCPECGRELGAAEGAPAAIAEAAPPQESKLDKLKGAAGFFRR
jgi:hypothetical protein